MRLIDADALIKQIEKNICEPCRKRKDDYNGVYCRACGYGNEIDDIEDAPTVAEWIPCSERLPEEKGKYLTTYHPCYWDDVKDELKIDVDTFQGKTFWAKRKHHRVIAWMPLPEAWRGEV